MTLHYDVANGYFQVSSGISRTCRFLRDQAGWTIPLSGINGVGPTGDNLGSGDFLASTDWVCMESPDGTKQILFTANVNPNLGMMVYSSGALFTGGTGISRATATDELIVDDGGEPLWAGGTSLKALWYADDSSPYGWYVTSYTSTSNCNCFLCWDPLNDTDPSDTDPYIIYMMGEEGPLSNYISSVSNATNAPHCAGTINDYRGTIPGLLYYTGTTQVIPGKGPNNVFNSNEMTWPVFFGHSAYQSLSGYKGVGTVVRWNGQSHSYGDTLSSMTRVCVGDCNIPWDGTTP